MKFFKSLLIVFAVAATAQAGILDGLDAYWPMDGNLEDVAGDLGSSANDVDDDGSIVGTEGSVSFADGKFGQGGLFDGEDGFVMVPDSADLAKGGQDLSISAWFRVDAFDTGWQALLGKGEGANYRIARQGGDTNMMAYAGGGTDLRGGPDVADGAWHHIVATTENGGLTAYYIDGTLVEDLSTRNPGQAAGIVDERSSDPVSLHIGANAGAAGREWEGGIDDVAIWNRVLTQGEITSLSQGSVASVVPEPASGLMLVFGVLGLLGLRRRR